MQGADAYPVIGPRYYPNVQSVERITCSHIVPVIGLYVLVS